MVDGALPVLRRRGPIALAAMVGGGLVIVGAWLPWLTLFAGLRSLAGVDGPNGRLLAAGGALSVLGGAWFLLQGDARVRWAIALLGFALLAGASWLTLQLLTTYRELAADPFTFAKLGPGLFVALAGSSLVFATLFLPGGTVDADPARSAEDLLAVAGLLSLLAAFVHVLAVPEHLAEWWGYGTFFVALALAQAGYALALLRWPRRWIVLVGIAGNLASIGLWAWTRTVGIPLFGPAAGNVESVGVLDVISKLAEGGLVVVLAALLWQLGRRRRTAALNPTGLGGRACGAQDQGRRDAAA